MLVPAVFLVGCANSSSNVAGQGAFASATASDNASYKVGPLDVLDISVFKVPDLSKSVQVSDTGSINLPLLGEVKASGKTAQEIERELTTRLGKKYLKNPQVTVFVKENKSQQVTIEGAVKKPGVYPIGGKKTLLQLVATAEGLNPDTYSSDVTIFRTVDGNRSSSTFDIDRIKAGKLDDPILQTGDVVVVDTSTAKVGFQNVLRVAPAASALRPF
jgi:polysaccharide export outer membrane protein